MCLGEGGTPVFMFYTTHSVVGKPSTARPREDGALSVSKQFLMANRLSYVATCDSKNVYITFLPQPSPFKANFHLLEPLLPFCLFPRLRRLCIASFDYLQFTPVNFSIFSVGEAFSHHVNLFLARTTAVVLELYIIVLV